MVKAFDPYRKWLGIPPEDQPPHHYRLLGLALFESDPDTIAHAADARMAHVKTFQAGRHAEVSQQILNQLAAAKVCLLKPESKQTYDQSLRDQLEVRQQAVVSSLPRAIPVPPALRVPPPVHAQAAPPLPAAVPPLSTGGYVRRRRKQSWLTLWALLLLVGVLAAALAAVLMQPAGPWSPEPRPGRAPLKPPAAAVPEKPDPPAAVETPQTEVPDEAAAPDAPPVEEAP